MKSFIEKHKPQSVEEIPQPLEKFKELIENKENVLIYGPTGSCKTSAVYSIADELDCEVIEINASNFRTKEQIEDTVGEASLQQSLFQKEKIILIEEADCLAGREDRGGAKAVLEIINATKFPIVITCNDPNNEKLKEIKKKVRLIEFKPITLQGILKILENICKKEGIIYEKEIVIKIAMNSNGDLRAAINDLQSNTINNHLLMPENKRECELSLTYVLDQVFKTKDIKANRFLENIDLDEYTLWLDENLPMQYNNEDTTESYKIISKADVFRGRIRRWQYWRFMYYQAILLSSGISVIKKKATKNTPYKRSLRPLKIWQYNIKNAKKISIAKKISKLTHTSTKEVIKNFRYYKNMVNNSEIAKEIKLDIDEIKFLNML